MAERKGKWGGPRRGAGRTPAPADTVRKNRVAIMLTDAELAKLQKLADEKELPLGTVAYEFVARGLKRRR